MASEPVTVSWESGTQFWTIRNSGRTKTLRIQQYGVAAVPLPPQSEMPLTGENVAVWIPVKPRALRRNENGEAFRLLILATKEPGVAFRGDPPAHLHQGQPNARHPGGADRVLR